MIHKILACICLAAISFVSCDNSNPTANNNTTDTTHTTDPNTHHNPANNPFVGKWVSILDTAKNSNSIWSDSIRKIACGCQLIVDDTSGNYHWENCFKPDTIVFMQDTILRSVLNSEGNEKYYYSSDSIYFKIHALCGSVNCTDTIDTVYSFTYKLVGDSLWVPYSSTEYSQFYMRGL